MELLIAPAAPILVLRDRSTQYRSCILLYAVIQDRIIFNYSLDYEVF